MLAAQTQGPELDPKNLCEKFIKLDVVAQGCNHNAGEMERNGSLGLTGQPS